MRHRLVAFAVLLTLAGGVPQAWAQKLGPEFRVNTNTVGQKKKPSVARLIGGGFVVVWESWGYQTQAQDGSKHGVYGQRYAADGTPLGAEFRVNSYTLNDQWQPSTAGLLNGGFVVTWTSFATSAAGQDGNRSGIFAQRYNASGAPVGAEGRVNTHTNADQEFSSVAGLSGGGFVVIWQSDKQDGSAKGVYGQRFSAAGAPAGNEFLVNTYKTNAQWHPSVAGLSDGGFVVVWESFGQESGTGIYGQRYTASGGRDGNEFAVNTTKALDQTEPSVAALAGGGFVVTWASYGQDEHLYGIYAQRYNDAGGKAGSEFRVNNIATGNQEFPSVGRLSDGGFVIAWHTNNNFGEIKGRRYNAAGLPVSGEFKVNTNHPATPQFPSVAGLDNSQYVVAWDTSAAGWAQRFGGVAPKISVHPVDKRVRNETTVNFTADAGGSPPPTVQWQQRVPTSRIFTNMPGQTTKTLSFVAGTSHNGNEYRAVFSNAAGIANTNAATLTVTGRSSRVAGAAPASSDDP